MFVSTRACPMCTGAILQAKIPNVRFFYENGYLAQFSDSLIAAESGRSFTEAGSDWLGVFGH
jgi:tRNA(Arg) A34 adenosine deaminase TadA